MNKHLILSLLAILLFSTCKKEKTAEIDAAGTYTLYSSNSLNTTTYTVETTPCLADNILILRSDKTSLAFYKGASPCHPSPNETIGSTDTTRSTWRVSNGKFFFGNKQSGEITTVNGKLQLTARDTIRPPAVSSPQVLVKVFLRQ